MKKSETATPLLRNIWRRSGENSIKYSSPSIRRPWSAPHRGKFFSDSGENKSPISTLPFNPGLISFNLSNNYFVIFCKSASSCCPFRTCSDPPLHQKMDFQREIRRRGSLILPLLPFCLQIGFSDETLSFFFSLQCTNLIFLPIAFPIKRHK